MKSSQFLNRETFFSLEIANHLRIRALCCPTEQKMKETGIGPDRKYLSGLEVLLLLLLARRLLQRGARGLLLGDLRVLLPEAVEEALAHLLPRHLAPLRPRREQRALRATAVRSKRLLAVKRRLQEICVLSPE